MDLTEKEEKAKLLTPAVCDEKGQTAACQSEPAALRPIHAQSRQKYPVQISSRIFFFVSIPPTDASFSPAAPNSCKTRTVLQFNYSFSPSQAAVGHNSRLVECFWRPGRTTRRREEEEEVRGVERDQRAERTSHTKSPSTNCMTVNMPRAQSSGSKLSATVFLGTMRV